MNEKIGFNKELCYLTTSLWGGATSLGTLGYNLPKICNIRIPYLFNMAPKEYCMYIGIILGVLAGAGIFRLYQRARKI